MVAPSAPRSLYVTRWKIFLVALFFSGGIVVDLLYYFVWPTPAFTANPWEYQEPAKTILFIVMLLFMTVLVLLALYWTFTPRPLLYLSASGLVYRPFPLSTRTINWDDVAHISAYVTKRNTTPVTHVTTLALWFTLRPDRLLTSSEQPPHQGAITLRIEINPQHLSLEAGELVELIRNYHDVEWLQTDRGAMEAEEQTR